MKHRARMNGQDLYRWGSPTTSYLLADSTDELLVLCSSETPSEPDTIRTSSRTLSEVFLIDRLNDQSISKARLRVGLGEGLELSCVCSGPRWGWTGCYLLSWSYRLWPAVFLMVWKAITHQALFSLGHIYWCNLSAQSVLGPLSSVSWWYCQPRAPL